MIGIIVIPTTLSQENGASIEEKRAQDLTQLEKISKNGQYGLEVQLAYELELGGRHLGSYIENFDTSSFNIDVETFLNQSFSEKQEFERLLQKEIIERYPTRENLQILKKKHPEAFLKLTQGLNTHEVNAWLSGEVLHIILPGQQVADKVEDNFRILGPDGKPAEKKPILIEPWGNNLVDLNKTQAGVYIPQTIISPAKVENNFLIKKNNVDIGDEISTRWNNYPELERHKIIEFDQLLREQKGWLIQYFKLNIRLEDLKRKPPSWMSHTNEPHWDGSMLEIETDGTFKTRSQFRKELSQVTKTLGLSDNLKIPLIDASRDYSLHLNISVKDYPPGKLRTFLIYYQDIMLGRLLNNEKKQVAAFTDSFVSYQNALEYKGFLRLNNAFSGYFEIRAQTKGPEETLDEVFKYLADMKNNEEETIARMKNEVRTLLTPKFFEEMLTSPLLPEKLNKLEKDIGKSSPAYQKELESIIADDAKQLKRKYDALNSILARCSGTNMKELQNTLIKIGFFDENLAREKLLELSQRPNFSLDNLINDHKNFLEMQIGEYFKDNPTIKIHAHNLWRGLWKQIPINDQIKIIHESHKSSSQWVFNQLLEIANLDKKVQNAIIEVFVKTLNDPKVIHESHTESSHWVFQQLLEIANLDKQVQNEIIDVFVTTLNDPNVQTGPFSQKVKLLLRDRENKQELLDRIYRWWKNHPTPSPPYNLVSLVTIFENYSRPEDVITLLKTELNNIPAKNLLEILDRTAKFKNPNFALTILETIFQTAKKETSNLNSKQASAILSLLPDHITPILEKIYPQKMEHIYGLQEIIKDQAIINRQIVSALQTHISNNTLNLDQLVDLIDKELLHAALPIINTQPYSINKLRALNKNNLDGLRVKEVNEFIKSVITSKDPREFHQALSILENSSQIPKESIEYIIQQFNNIDIVDYIKFYANSKLENKFKISPSYKKEQAEALRSFEGFLNPYNSDRTTISLLEKVLPQSEISGDFIEVLYEEINLKRLSSLEVLTYLYKNHLSNYPHAQKKIADIMNAKDLSRLEYSIERYLELTTGLENNNYPIDKFFINLVLQFPDTIPQDSLNQILNRIKDKNSAEKIFKDAYKNYSGSGKKSNLVNALLLWDNNHALQAGQNISEALKCILHN